MCCVCVYGSIKKSFFFVHQGNFACDAHRKPVKILKSIVIYESLRVHWAVQRKLLLQINDPRNIYE